VLVLASASPRRADLLRKLQLPFRQQPMDLDETLPPGLGPDEAAMLLAHAKADAAAATLPEGWVLGADTIVWLDGHAQGKPAHADEALAMLQRLQGRTHEVVTGVCVVRLPGGKAWQGSERTEVRFAALPDKLLEAYVATGEPLGKAGAYAIQGIAAAYLEGVRGPVDNVIGLPLRRTVELLEASGYPLPEHLRLGRPRQP
jgi:septum formation protein